MHIHPDLASYFKEIQGNKILVKPIPKEDARFGSLVIPSTANNIAFEEGEVVAVSPSNADMYHLGDIVCYPSNSGIGQRVERQHYKWLHAEPNGNVNEVWAILTPAIAQPSEEQAQ
jgi:co-chaperonin GroES (HSP10)